MNVLVIWPKNIARSLETLSDLQEKNMMTLLELKAQAGKVEKMRMNMTRMVGMDARKMEETRRTEEYLPAVDLVEQ